MNTPPPRLPAQAAFGVVENGNTPIIVKATSRGRTLTFSKAALGELTPPPSGTVVAAPLLHRESFTRWLTAPIASPRKAATVFPSLLDIQLPFSIEDCQITLVEKHPTPDRSGTRGLVAGARNADIEKRLAALSAIGVNPHVLDQEAIALWSHALVEYPPPDMTLARIVLYLAADRVTLAAGQGGEFIGAHTMRQIDADQIHRVMKSYFPSKPDSIQWLWSGPGAMDQTAIEPLHGSLAARWPGSFKVVREPETFLARAVAARSLASQSTCNLRTGQFLHPALSQFAEKRPHQWAIACLAAGTLLCALNLAGMTAIQHRLSTTQRQLRALAAEIIGSPRGIQPGQEVLMARRALETQTKAMEPFLASTDLPLQNSLTTLLCMAQQEGVSIETMTLSRDNGVVHGLAPKFMHGEKLARRLNEKTWTTTVEQKESPRGDERAAFVIGLKPSREKR